MYYIKYDKTHLYSKIYMSTKTDVESKIYKILNRNIRLLNMDYTPVYYPSWE